MDLDETMVEDIDTGTEEDSLPDEVVEESDDSEEESLDSLTEDGEPADEQPKQEPQSAGGEPGYVKKRIDKAVARAVAETEARMQAMFDRQMAPIREKMLNDEARELVRQGEFKSLERAKEYLQLKQGLPVGTQSEAPKPQAQPRNAQGQFAPKTDPAIQAQIKMLAHQADTIKAKRGVDVMKEFNSNPEIKQKIMSGEMDFYEVAEQMASRKSKRPPAPMRSPNGASGQNPNAIDTMSDDQFDRMEKRIKEGARYSLK